MEPSKKTARIAGGLYLLMAITGAFSILYVPETLIVPGDAAITVQNILDSEWLFRLGFVSGLLCQATFVFLVLELYKLLKGVDRQQAFLMVALVVVAVPIACLNMLNQWAALLLLSGAEYLTGLWPDQLNAQVMFFLEMHAKGIFIAQIFWGLWLLPLGLLVIKSGFFPKILGIFLVAGCFGYLIDFLRQALFPESPEIISTIATIPSGISEISITLWLLIKGVKEPPA